jgi:SAM-dependent methyltransferase
MSAGELEAFYLEDYRLLRQGTTEPIATDLQAQEARAVVALRLLGSRLSGVSRHLDFGSSSGALLEAFRDRFGCDGVGIEPGEAYRRFSRARGLQVLRGLEDLEELGGNPFDLVTAMHVLEHLADPVAMLAMIQTQHLRPGAFLLVEVPNLADHQAFELAHLHAFTSSSLTDAVRRAGFDVVWTKTHGGYRSPVLRLYITVLARAGGERRRSTYIPFAALRPSRAEDRRRQARVLHPLLPGLDMAVAAKGPGPEQHGAFGAVRSRSQAESDVTEWHQGELAGGYR